MPTEEQSVEVTIIGGGPIGIELAAALAASETSYVLIEAGSIGSTIEWWAPGTRWFSSPERISIAGVPLVTPNEDKATREEYLRYLRGVVGQHDLNVRTGERVTRIERDADGFSLTIARSDHGVGGPAEEADAPDAATGRRTLRARQVVLAIGNMHRARRLDIPGEDLPHVSHYLDDPHRYFRRRVVIVGGKNSAVEAALRCYRCGVDVALSYRGDTFDPKRVKYWLRPEIEWLIDKGRIAWHPRTTPVAIEPDRLVIASVDDETDTRALDADFVLLLTGYVQDRTLFDQLGVECAGPTQAPVFDRKTMRTNVPGVFVAGTATGGSQQRARVFLENCHVHVERIARAITGAAAPWSHPAEYARLEES
ncbi:MAG: NAD(P)-binding domain-containing protein [Planctomycetes bacterium]|nr:NAD(P)-binding domain-containing protein [Planctomycetota bacterium]